MPMFILLLTTTCLLLVVLYLYYRWQYRHILAAAAKLPHPPTIPLLGNALMLIQSASSVNETITKFAISFHGRFCIWLGPTPIFLLSNPADIKAILTTSKALEKDFSYEYFKPYMGNGIVTSPVHIWKKYRRLINPMFHSSNVKAFQSVYNDVGRNIVSYIRQNINKPVDSKEAIMGSTLIGASNIVFGSSDIVDKQFVEKFLFILDWVGKSFITRITNPFLHFDWIFNIVNRSQVNHAMKLYTDIYNIVRREKSKFQSLVAGGEKDKRLDDDNGLKLMDIVMNDSITDEHWTEEILTILAAATDTMLSTITLTLFTLANHPQVQNKIYSEICDVIGESKDDVTIDDLQKMDYLDLVMLESIRLHGTIPLIGKKTTGSIKLGGDVILPTGCRVIISLHAGGWDPEVFPDAHQFRPERFSSDVSNQKVRPQDAFSPFSAGPRNCIGKSYSKLLLKSVIVHILREFTLSSQMKMEDLEYELKSVMFTKNPLLLLFQKR